MRVPAIAPVDLDEVYDQVLDRLMLAKPRAYPTARQAFVAMFELLHASRQRRCVGRTSPGPCDAARASTSAHVDADARLEPGVSPAGLEATSVARATRGRVLHRCIECTTLIPSGTRCAMHERARERRRGTPTQRGYGAAWQRTAREVVKTHVKLYGWVCPGYKRAPHASRDLTVDHVEPLARGGRGDVIAVLCRSCNASKGDR